MYSAARDRPLLLKAEAKSPKQSNVQVGFAKKFPELPNPMERVWEAENGYFATRILIRVISVVSSEAWADLIRLRSAAKLLRNDSGSNDLSHLGQALAIAGTEGLEASTIVSYLQCPHTRLTNLMSAKSTTYSSCVGDISHPPYPVAL
jgi:hypothetical protein